MSQIPERLLENDFLALKKCKHGTFAYNINDSFIGRSLDLYGEWGEGEIGVFDKIIKPDSIVLDVGANIGTHTVFLAKKVGPKGHVFAFEPQRLVHQILCTNIALNALTNVTCKNSAAGETNEDIVVPVVNPRTNFNFGALSISGHEKGEKIPKIKIDDLSLARCHLIKIDVEGMEKEVLQGAGETIAAHKPLIFVENNRGQGSEELIGTLFEMGYKCWWHIAPYYNRKNFFNNEENIFEQYAPEANMLCIHETRPAQINLPQVEGVKDNWRAVLTRVMGRGKSAIPAEKQK